MVLLYSDKITYGNSQELPGGWSVDKAAEEANKYTKTVLEELKRAGATQLWLRSEMKLTITF